MMCALPAQRAAERLCARGTDAVRHRLCGAEDCLWLPFGAAAATGKKKNPNMPCKNNQPEAALGVFHAPIANGFDHRVVFTPPPPSS